MLTDPKEIAIISKAKQKNIRDHRRSREHFHRIFSDFFATTNFSEKVLLDLGPGQYDFGEIARSMGAKVYGIDKDPAVIELGEYKGLKTIDGDLRKLGDLQLSHRFDGIFCKFSVNAFWFHHSEQQHIQYIKTIDHLMTESGWAWLAPWNGVPKKANLSAQEIERTLQIQTTTFKALGFKAVNLSDSLSKYYGVHGITANRSLFTKNIELSSSLVAQCGSL